MAHEHNYKLTALWTGNKGDGTISVQAYDRSTQFQFKENLNYF